MASDSDVTAPLLSPTTPPTVVIADTAATISHNISTRAAEVQQSASGWFHYIAEQTRKLKHNCVVLFYALQDKRTSKCAKFMPLLVLAYVLSPLDLIPDCIPVLGLVDDILIAPALIWLAIKLIPDEVLADAKLRAVNEPLLLSSNWTAATLIFILWVLGLELVLYIVLRKFFWGYAVVQSWFGTFLALVLVVAVAAFIWYVFSRTKYERELKRLFDDGVRQAREAVLVAEAAVPSAPSAAGPEAV